MLSREDCDRFEVILHKEIATRKQLGGYSPDAGTIEMLCSLGFELIRHIKETLPDTTTKRPKPKKDPNTPPYADPNH